MKKTCGLAFTALIVFIAGYIFLIRRLVPEMEIVPLIVISGFGGFALVALLGAIAGVIQRIKDKQVIQNALSGKPFLDGKNAAAFGRLEPSGLSLCTSPFTGKECVAYEYEVYAMVRTGKSAPTKKVFCSGYGMVPPVVKSRQGDIRLLGFPLLDEWPKTEIEDPAERERAQEFLSQTRYQDLKASNISSVFAEFEDLFGDEDGQVRKDLGESVQIQENHILTEIVVTPGLDVCALGTYSAAKSALTAGKNLAMPIRLIPGDVATATKLLKKKSIAQITFALMFFLFVHGILGTVYYFYQKQKRENPRSNFPITTFEWRGIYVHRPTLAESFFREKSIAPRTPLLFSPSTRAGVAMLRNSVNSRTFECCNAS